MDYLNNSTHLGDIGEAQAIASFTKAGCIPLLPISDNLPYDLAVDIKGKIYKIQVKTTIKVREDGLYKFHTKRLNGFTQTSSKYSTSEVDYLFLYCIEDDYKGLISINELSNREILNLRINVPKNNQYKKILYAKDFIFTNKIKALLDL